MPNGWCARPFWSWRDWGTSSLAGHGRPPRFVFLLLIGASVDARNVPWSVGHAGHGLRSGSGRNTQC